MGTSDRAVQLGKLIHTQPKVKPLRRYEYFVGGRGSNKESAMLARLHETTTERNDALDALEYSLGSAISTQVTTASSTTAGTTYAFGSSPRLEPTLFTPSGATGPYVGSVAEQAEQRIIGRQTQDLLHCIYTLSYVFQSLTERRIELDSSDLRTLEPFEYRIRMNQLDELFMFVAHLMDNMTVESRPEWLKETLTEKGLL